MQIFMYKGTRSSSSKAVDVKLATINDIPTSIGAWKEHYDSRQKVYNAQLITGIIVLIGTITYVCIKFILIQSQMYQITKSYSYI